MEFFVENWYLIVAAVAVLFGLVVNTYVFAKKPTSEQLKAVKEWLLYAVIEAERQLGSGTGQVKLRYVYDMFVSKFGFLANIISFEMFSKMVDEALERMGNMLKDNKAVSNYVQGK